MTFRLGLVINTSGNAGIYSVGGGAEYSNRVVDRNTWYSAALRREGDIAQLFIDGELVLTSTVQTTGAKFQREFWTNNTSNGTYLTGCIRELKITNDTQLDLPEVVFCDGFETQPCEVATD